MQYNSDLFLAHSFLLAYSDFVNVVSMHSFEFFLCCSVDKVVVARVKVLKEKISLGPSLKTLILTESPHNN